MQMGPFIMGPAIHCTLGQMAVLLQHLEPFKGYPMFLWKEEEQDLG